MNIRDFAVLERKAISGAVEKQAHIIRNGDTFAAPLSKETAEDVLFVEAQTEYKFIISIPIDIAIHMILII